MDFLFRIFHLIIISYIRDSLSLFSDCNWNISHLNSPEVYWINLEESHDRREAMESFLNKTGLRHYRIKAISYKELFVPLDLQERYQTEHCTSTSWKPNNKDIEYKTKRMNFAWWALQSYPEKYYIKALCGASNNKVTELQVLGSHLMAIYRAVYSKSAKSRYALILEDDVWSPFQIDLEAMVETVSDGFAFLQLMNSKPMTVKEYYIHYKANPKYNYWIDRPSSYDGRILPTWCTGAYLIDRTLLKDIIDKLVDTTEKGWISFSVLAGNVFPKCRPASCCTQTAPLNESSASKALFIDPPKLPCVYAPVGFQADSFIYALAKTLTISFPLFVAHPNGVYKNSTIHQDHVAQHKVAFKRSMGYALDMLTGDTSLPTFLKHSCDSKVLLDNFYARKSTE